MGWPVSIGWVVFVAVPLAIWIAGALAIRGHGFAVRVLGFVAGSDNRLSLSRFQAFLWTLVIFGSFAAAMSIHKALKLSDPWIKIPPELLALGGIAIGSGVFSSLISAVNGDQATARLVSINSLLSNDQTLKTNYPEMSPPTGQQCLLITGSALGDGGRIRLSRKGHGKTALTVLFWRKDGSLVIVDLPNDVSDFCHSTLIVETSNGKLTYNLDGALKSPSLSNQIINYEFADLFRDDKNPESLSLMKFQMFGWTSIAISIYVYLFLSNLSADIATLPVVDKSVVILTGLSQTGYLAGKGVSTVSPNH